MLHGAKGRKLSTCPVDQGNKQLTVQVSQPAYISPLEACLCSNLQADMNLVCLYPSQLKAARHITAESNLKLSAPPGCLSGPACVCTNMVSSWFGVQAK